MLLRPKKAKERQMPIVNCFATSLNSLWTIDMLYI
jgi:hypothetical protein